MTQETNALHSRQPVLIRPDFIRFILVLGIGAVIDLGTMNVLLWVFNNISRLVDIGIPMASGAGFVCGLISNYVLHRYWTFGGAKRNSVGWQLPVFVVVSLSALLLRLVLVSVVFPLAHQGSTTLAPDAALARTLSANIAQIAAMGSSMLWNYYANRRWTYRVTSEVPEQ